MRNNSMLCKGGVMVYSFLIFDEEILIRGDLKFICEFGCAF